MSCTASAGSGGMLITNSDAGDIANTAMTSAWSSVARSTVHSSARCEPSVPSTPTTMVLIISSSFLTLGLLSLGGELWRANPQEVRARADADEQVPVHDREVLDALLDDPLQGGDGHIVRLHGDDVLTGVLEQRLPIVEVDEEQVGAGDDPDTGALGVDDRVRAVAATRERATSVADRCGGGQGLDLGRHELTDEHRVERVDLVVGAHPQAPPRKLLGH